MTSRSASALLGILLFLLPSAYAAPPITRTIPRDIVDVSISETVTGLNVHLDFSRYRRLHPVAEEGERFSFRLAIPRAGTPAIHIQAKTVKGETISDDVSAFPGKPVILGGLRIVSVTVPATVTDENGCRALETIDATVDFGVRWQSSQRPVSPAFRSLFRNMLLNPPALTGTDDFDPEHLLIICPDFAETNLQPFVEWKRRKGLECTLSTLGEIGIGPEDDVGLKAYLQEAYDTWENPPDFVLLAGDETVLPVHWDFTLDPPTLFSSASVPGWYTDENWFACLDGDDFFPDIIISRWVVDTEYEYAYLTSKSTRYEMYPNLTQTDWYRKAVVAAQDTLYYQGDPSMRLTVLETRQMMLDYGFTQVDTLFGGFNPYQLTLWLNEGRSYLNYRGSGWTMGWAGINYYINNLENLSNSFMLPVVTGIGCGVCIFTDPETGFGEQWMLLGSISDQRGAIAFIGPCWNTHTYYNDQLDLGIYSSIFENGEERIGASLIAGKAALYDYFDDWFASDPNIEEIVRVAFNQYCMFGDPELKPYNDVPAALYADFPAAVSTGPQPVEITVTDESGDPYEGALVCLYLPGDFQEADLTDSEGSVTLTSNATTLPAYVYLTVTAFNHAPVLDSILVITDSQYVLHLSYELDDNSGGNGDGGLSPGEEVLWTETLKNYGILTAPGVEATLSSDHPLVTMTQDTSSYGDILPQQTAVGTPDYILQIAPESYTIGDEITFRLDISDAVDSSWTSLVTLPLLTPALEVINLDPDPSGNNRLDRGETCDLSFGLRNSGSQAISDGTAELHSDDPYVEIIQGAVPVGNLNVGGIFYSGSTPFTVSISPYTPTMHEITFLFKLVSEEATYTFADSASFTFAVGEYGAGDPTQGPTGLYYAYETKDTLYSESPAFEWMEIDPDSGGFGDILPFSNEIQVVTVDLPFTFTYWGEDFTRLTVSADGWVAPGEITSVPPDNYQLPHTDGVPGMIAALWDNLWNPTSEEGRVCAYFDADNGKYIIEWDNISHYSSASPKETFQIVLCDPVMYPTRTGDAEIIFYYRDLNFFGIMFSTSGIESPDELWGINYSYNDSLPVTAFGLEDSSAIRWTTDEPFITAVPPAQVGATRIPRTFRFDPAYPNPFNPETNLRFALPAGGIVTLEIYDIQGRKVRTLQRGALPPGIYQIPFSGAYLGSGVYFARLQYDHQTKIRKLLLVK